MNREHVKAALDANPGKIFKVRFTKRTTGEERTMIARLGVKAHLKGGTKAFDDKDYGLITAFDMQKQAYRSIPCDAIHEITIAGQEFQE